MSARHVKHLLDSYSETLRELVERFVKQTGLTPDDCQRTSLLVTLNELDAKINGLTDEDVKHDDE